MLFAMKQYTKTWEGGNALDEREVCDTPDEVMHAIAELPEYGEAVIVQREGEPIAAIIPMTDFELYKRLFDEHQDRLDVEAVEAARAEGGPTVSLEDLVAELGLDMAELER